MGHPKFTSSSAMAEGPRDALVSINTSRGPIVWHYLHDPTFSRFDRIAYRSVTDTHTDTDRHTTTAYSTLSIASRIKNQLYCTAHKV